MTRLAKQEGMNLNEGDCNQWLMLQRIPCIKNKGLKYFPFIKEQ